MDTALLQELNGLVSIPGIRQFAWLVAQPWSAVLLVLIFLVDVARRKRWIELAPLVLAAIAADVLCARVLKELVQRPRPCVSLDTVVAPFGCGAGFSMPSCHATTVFALAMVVNRPWAFALALVVALARSVAGVHYPSDLLAGAVVGLAIGWLLRWVLVSLERSRKRPPR